jgi:hypothetical protein
MYRSGDTPNEPQPQGACELQGRQIEAPDLSALVLPIYTVDGFWPTTNPHSNLWQLQLFFSRLDGPIRTILKCA